TRFSRDWSSDVCSSDLMDIFGPDWDNYMGRIQENWIKIIRPDDLVLLPGDLSWATYIEKSDPDFLFIESLPGKKIISKGNHDYRSEERRVGKECRSMM